MERSKLEGLIESISANFDTLDFKANCCYKSMTHLESWFKHNPNVKITQEDKESLLRTASLLHTNIVSMTKHLNNVRCLIFQLEGNLRDKGKSKETQSKNQRG